MRCAQIECPSIRATLDRQRQECLLWQSGRTESYDLAMQEAWGFRPFEGKPTGFHDDSPTNRSLLPETK